MNLLARWFLICVLLGCGLPSAEPGGSPEILRISPTSGTEGSRIVITGLNLGDATGVLLGNTACSFKVISPEELIAIVPHKTANAVIKVITPYGQGSSPFAFVALSDPRIPEEVSYKAGYVGTGPPPGFTSVLLWGIAIADTRVSGYEAAAVEVAWTELSCRADGKDIVLNHDVANVRGGLYRRIPWFGTDEHEPMTLVHGDGSVKLRVGQRADRVWHFWSASPRPQLPPGRLEGCTVSARVRISPGGLLQIGMDYWRNSTVPYGSGGNNHEAGVSNWYFPSRDWQEAVFSDIGGPQF